MLTGELWEFKSIQLKFTKIEMHCSTFNETHEFFVPMFLSLNCCRKLVFPPHPTVNITLSSTKQQKVIMVSLRSVTIGESNLVWQPDRSMCCTQERTVPLKLCPVVGLASQQDMEKLDWV